MSKIGDEFFAMIGPEGEIYRGYRGISNTKGGVTRAHTSEINNTTRSIATRKSYLASSQIQDRYRGQYETNLVETEAYLENLKKYRLGRIRLVEVL